jgi:hypothetical protein
MKTKTMLFVTSAMMLAGCTGMATQDKRVLCDDSVDAAWSELDIAKTRGFAGSVSYSKALSLLTMAKSQQAVESFDNCIRNAEKARYYIRQSMEGR